MGTDFFSVKLTHQSRILFRNRTADLGTKPPKLFDNPEFFKLKLLKNFRWKNSGLSNNFDGLFPNHLSGSGLKFRINESILHWKNPFPLNSVRIPNIPDYRGPDYRDMTVFIFAIWNLYHTRVFFYNRCGFNKLKIFISNQKEKKPWMHEKVPSQF